MTKFLKGEIVRSTLKKDAEKPFFSISHYEGDEFNEYAVYDNRGYMQFRKTSSLRKVEQDLESDL